MALPGIHDALHKKGRMKIKMALVKERVHCGICDKTNRRRKCVCTEGHLSFQSHTNSIGKSMCLEVDSSVHILTIKPALLQF